MKKQFLTLFTGLLMLSLLLTACGSQDSNSGLTKDQSTTGTKTNTTVALHSGNCWTRDGELASHADIAENTEPPRWSAGGSPFFGGTVVSCVDNIELSWDTGYDFYQIRWSRPGVNEQQFSTANKGSYTFNNIHFSTIYKFYLQGCNEGLFGSDCTHWSPVITFATYNPGECHVGYVWRGANPNDHVCVTPQTRDQTSYDNSQRYNRIDPNGAYGPNSCIQGYVWREAYNDDLVCVTPQVRSQASYDNSQADQRSYH